MAATQGTRRSRGPCPSPARFSSRAKWASRISIEPAGLVRDQSGDRRAERGFGPWREAKVHGAAKALVLDQRSRECIGQARQPVPQGRWHFARLSRRGDDPARIEAKLRAMGRRSRAAAAARTGDRDPPWDAADQRQGALKPAFGRRQRSHEAGRCYDGLRSLRQIEQCAVDVGETMRTLRRAAIHPQSRGRSPRSPERSSRGSRAPVVRRLPQTRRRAHPNPPCPNPHTQAAAFPQRRL